MTGSFDVLDKSCRHIYHSALALAPRSSMVWKLYGERALPIADVLYGLPNSWDSSIATTKRSDSILTATWSPCSTYIATTWENSTTIEILDPVTLARHDMMNSPSKGAKVASFSPDSRSLACCGCFTNSSNKFLVIWDIHTGGEVRTKEHEMQVNGYPSSITYSKTGTMIGVSYLCQASSNGPGLNDPSFAICIYSVDTGDLIHSHSSDDTLVEIWAHGQSFQFATVEPGAITVRGVEITSDSNHKVVEIETLEVHSRFNPSEPFLFFPDLSRLACVMVDTVLIWDTRRSKPLLKSKDVSFQGSKMSFSPDGEFFACGTAGPDVYLWKESPAGYTLHQKLISSTLSPIPLFSPNMASVVTWDSSMIQLWPLETPAGPTLVDPPQVTGRTEHFILDFSPGGKFAVITRGKSDTVSIVDLELGVQRQTTDAGMEVCGLRIVGDIVVADGPDKFITWALSADTDPGVATRVGDIISTTTFAVPRPIRSQSASISPDLHHIAVRGDIFRGSLTRPLYIHDVATGGFLARVPAAGDMAWFSRDGSQIWCDGEVGEEQGWEVARDDGSARASLNPLPTGSVPDGYPWRSPRGYTVTDDGWVLDPVGKRLLWLPPRWRSYERKTRVWNGPFLALLHNTLPEPVVLKLKV